MFINLSPFYISIYNVSYNHIVYVSLYWLNLQYFDYFFIVADLEIHSYTYDGHF
jgi:hypothetical protein